MNRRASADASKSIRVHQPERQRLRSGIRRGLWTPVWAYSADPTPETEAAIRQALSLEAIRWQYLHGTPDPSLVSPDTREHDHALIQRPGNDQIQLRLFRDDVTNRALYPQVQVYFRTSQVPLLGLGSQ